MRYDSIAKPLSIIKKTPMIQKLINEITPLLDKYKDELSEEKGRGDFFNLLKSEKN